MKTKMIPLKTRPNFYMVSSKEIPCCPVCGGMAGVFEFSPDGKTLFGIGDVGCLKSFSNVLDENNNKVCGSIIFHYSGKFGVSKMEAIGKYKEYVVIKNINERI